jgi:hypothetical protein
MHVKFSTACLHYVPDHKEQDGLLEGVTCGIFASLTKDELDKDFVS